MVAGWRCDNGDPYVGFPSEPLPSALLCICAYAQETPPKLKVSEQPLSEERVAVYRAVLKRYMKYFGDVLNLANETEPLDLSGPLFDESCVKGIALEKADNSTPLVHKLGPSVAIGRNIVLLDPEQQELRIRENDFQNLLRKGAEQGKQVTDEELDKPLKQGFATGLFSLSEMAFDKPHRHAIVIFNFVCGRLCGNGGIVIVKKGHDGWKAMKPGRGWIS